MTPPTPPITVDPAGPLRRGLLVLAGLGTIGTGLELAALRHWDGTLQLVPWAALAVTAVAVVLLAFHPTAGVVRTVRWVALGLVLVAALGTYEHVLANYHVAPLDAVYGTRWPTMSAPARWWAAASGAVGPSPALAPAVLAQSALCLLLACVRHPALGRVSEEAAGGGMVRRDGTQALGSGPTARRRRGSRLRRVEHHPGFWPPGPPFDVTDRGAVPISRTRNHLTWTGATGVIVGADDRDDKPAV